jgi:membrane protein
MLFDLGMIILSNLLFLATMGVTAGITWLKVSVGLFRDPSALLELVEVVGLIASVVFSIALFFLLYRFVPSCRIPTRRALGAAVLAAVLWEVAKQLFRWYVTTVGVYGQIYGPLGVLVALVMWIYYSAIVCVLGAEVIGARGGEPDIMPVSS